MSEYKMKTSEEYAQLAEYFLEQPDVVSLRPKSSVQAQVYASLAVASAQREMTETLDSTEDLERDFDHVSNQVHGLWQLITDHDGRVIPRGEAMGLGVAYELEWPEKTVPAPVRSSVPVTPFDFDREEDGSLSLSSAVFQALGAASMAWTERPTGVFESEWARLIGEALMVEIEKHQASTDSEVIRKRFDANREQMLMAIETCSRHNGKLDSLLGQLQTIASEP